MKKLTVLPIVVFTSVITATGLVLFLANPISAAEKSGGVVMTSASGRAAPIKTVAEFDKVFTARFNEGIKLNASKQGGCILDETINPIFVNKRLVTWETARKISRAELEKLRSNISAGLKEASAKRMALTDIANGSIGDNFFAGKIVAPSAVKTNVKTDLKTDVKPGN